MKNIYLTLICFLVTFTMKSQIVQTFPYEEDFEGLSSCPTGCGAACDLSSGSFYSNDLSDDLDWITDQNGTGSSATGPSFDHTLGSTGNGNYLYVESSCSGSGYPNYTANLLSPQIDLTGANQMQFEFWWHMFGSSMGVMHLDVSNDLGSTWNNDVIPAWTDNQDLWQQTTVSLGAYTNDTIIVRIRFVTGTSFYSDAAIDDIKIYDLLPVDAGVSYIDSPAVQTCNLSSDIWVTIQNYGVDTLTSATINYSVNGPGSSGLAPYTWQGSLAQNADTTIQIGSYSFVVGDSLKVWTSQPNGTTEMLTGAGNDTNNRIIVPYGLSGSYYLGGINSDFNSFNEAINTMDSLGVCGPINIYVNDSIYNEQIEIHSFTNLSSANSITFTSLSGNNMLSGINFSSTGSVDNYTVKFVNTHNITFNNLMLSNDGTSYGNVLIYEGSSSNIKIDSCMIIGDSSNTSSSYFKALVRRNNSNSNANSNVFSNNTFKYGSYSVYYDGYNANYDSATVLSNNQFLDYSYNAIRMVNQNGCHISNNYFSPDSSIYSYVYDINIYDLNGDVQVNDNVIIKNNSYGDAIAIEEYNYSFPSMDTCKVFNNFISITDTIQGNSISNGIYSYDNSNIYIANNTINILSNSNSSCILTEYDNNMHIVNNNLVNTGSGYGVYLYSGSVDESNFNNIYVTNGDLFYNGSTSYDLATWQNASGNDLNSYASNPLFASNDDYHTCNDTLDMTGTPLYFVTHDLDGNLRSSTPDIGADEFFGMAKFSLGNDETICSSDSILIGPASDLVSYNWSNGSVTSTVNVPSGTYSVVVNGACGTAADTIVIDNFPSAVADFTTTPSYLTLICSNNSLNYDSLFWDFGDGNTSNLDNPIHVYDSIGTYVVLLTVYNQCGSDTMSFSFSTNLGLTENELFTDFNVYPNPNIGSFNLEASLFAPNNVSVALTNVLGQVVYSKDLGFINNGDLNHFVQLDKPQKGLFFVTLVSGDTKIVKIVNVK